MRGGVTGHQYLGATPVVRWVKVALEEVITQHGITEGITCLAAGADQLYAETLSSKAIPYIAVIPSRSYEAAFDGAGARAQYRKYLEKASRSIQLAFDQPEERAFLEAGKTVVDLSDILIAIWDGRPARGLGGTGDIVAYALSRNRCIIQIDPHGRSVLELSSGIHPESL